MGGLLGLLAVLAFVILAAVILTRREPGTVADLPPASPVVPPTTTLAAPSPEAPAPSADPALAAASAETATAEPAIAEPVAAGAAVPGKPSRPPRRAGTASTDGTRVAEARPAPAPRGAGALPPGSSSRRFVLGTTSIESLKAAERGLQGFEPSGVGVKRAPEVNGRVELEMDPAQVRPGVDYTVKVYLANDGSKDIPVQELKVSTVEDGKTASRTMTPRARSVKPRERALLHEVTGVWREAARTWSMDVVVTSGRRDVYRNRLRWE
jgi:hypothetical protein